MVMSSRFGWCSLRNAAHHQAPAAKSAAPAADAAARRAVLDIDTDSNRKKQTSREPSPGALQKRSDDGGLELEARRHAENPRRKDFIQVPESRGVEPAFARELGVRVHHIEEIGGDVERQ